MRLPQHARHAGNGSDEPMARLRREIDRLFELPWEEANRDWGFHGGWAPSVDIYESNDELIVKAELPGMKKEEIELTVHEGTLTISGERKHQRTQEEVQASRAERYFGRFQRTVSLNKPIDLNEVKATYRDGILTIELPKREEAKPKQIAIKAA